MKTTVSEFRRQFTRMRKLAASGETVTVEADGETYEFRARRKDSLLGCMAGTANLENLREGPAFTLEEWGDLA
ncbi:hypothetical protein AXK11_01565 [Cephaloticoccus primus]|uniref:Uncharacterized protein n=1 Tax=Cephaloticoccus primus TaxID=1548207 RepID=A0A139STD6_9BACT|nr:hypothetical protein [Cephaloticoccus primus]KXU37868.1 hypothetical protein AXK11_01565 [Cephaloticoccus primus]